jgi:hypothetical protein
MQKVPQVQKRHDLQDQYLSVLLAGRSEMPQNALPRDGSRCQWL